MAFGLSATAIASLGTAALGAYSASKGSKQSGSATSTTQQQLDPRIDSMLFGPDGKSGLLSQHQSLMNTPQSDAMKAFGSANSDYLTKYAAGDMGASRDAAYKLMQGNTAPTSGPLSWATGNQIQAPSQNGLDLSGAYSNMINGDPAANPYLTGAIKKGINQSSNAFNAMQDSATSNLMKTVLPSIRSNSVLAGQYGGSRQGVAEGNAIGDFAKAQQQAISQFGQNNTDAAVAAQAGAFESGQNRALAAMQGLSGQQYATAGQNAATKNAAEFMNVGNVADWNRQNLQSQLQTNGMNNGSLIAGAGMLGNLTGSAANATDYNDNYALNRAKAVNGLLAPYLSANQSSTSSQPIYENKTGNMLGGALLGGQLAGSLFGGGNGNTGIAGPFKGEAAGGLFDLFSGSFGV